MSISTDYLCDDCNKNVGCEFHVDATLWHLVTDSKDIPENLTNSYDGGEGYLCLACFAVRAYIKGITSFVVEVTAIV